MYTRLVQLINESRNRAVALVAEPHLHLLKDFGSVYELITMCIDQEKKLIDFLQKTALSETLRYDDVYHRKSSWRLLPAFDHPEDVMQCVVSGTGLTHLASAENRQKMHQATTAAKETDSMKMYRWGKDGGKPNEGTIGVQPEWFYKGNGGILRAHGESLAIPGYAEDGGEEPEIAGIYYVDRQGIPYRIGMATANEFSDHGMERRNYLYLAPSKIRQCAIGPELVIGAEFKQVAGTVSIERQGRLLWKKEVKTGEKNMTHSLDNLEHHHFKYANHRLPGQCHIHFFGADAFSFGEGIELQDGDAVKIKWDGFGRPLINRIRFDVPEDAPFTVRNLAH